MSSFWNLAEPNTREVQYTTCRYMSSLGSVLEKQEIQTHLCIQEPTGVGKYFLGRQHSDEKQKKDVRTMVNWIGVERVSSAHVGDSTSLWAHLIFTSVARLTERNHKWLQIHSLGLYHNRNWYINSIFMELYYLQKSSSSQRYLYLFTSSVLIH